MRRWEPVIRRLTLLVTLVLVLMLSGCRLDVVVDVDMANNGSGKVTVTATADEELMKSQPDLVDDLDFTDAEANGWEIGEPTVAADGSTTLTLTHAFADKAELANVLSSIGPPLSPNNVGVARTSDGRQVVNAISGQLVLPDGYASFADSDLVAAAGGVPFATELNNSSVPPEQGLSFVLNVNLPGRLVSAPSGTDTGDGTIQWIAPMDGQIVGVEIETVQQIGGGNNWWARPVSWISLVLLVIWSVFAVVFIIYVVYARRQRARNRHRAVRNLSETRVPQGRRRRR